MWTKLNRVRYVCSVRRRVRAGGDNAPWSARTSPGWATTVTRSLSPSTASPATADRVPSGTTGAGDRWVSEGRGEWAWGGHSMAWESGMDTASPATLGHAPSGTTGAGDRLVSEGRASDGNSKLKEGAGLVDRWGYGWNRDREPCNSGLCLIWNYGGWGPVSIWGMGRVSLGWAQHGPGVWDGHSKSCNIGSCSIWNYGSWEPVSIWGMGRVGLGWAQHGLGVWSGLGKSCNSGPCPIWNYGSWGQVSTWSTGDGGPWVGTASPATAGHAPCGTTGAGDL